MNSIAFNIIGGKQWILGNMITIESYAGIGYGYAGKRAKNLNFPIDDYYVSNYYSHIFSSNEFPISFTGGMTIGCLY